MAAGTADNLRFAVPGDIRKSGGLVIEHIKNYVPLPMAFTGFGVFVPGGFFAGEAIDDNVGPAILIEVVGEEEEAVGVGIVHTQAAFEARNGFFGAVGFFSFE